MSMVLAAGSAALGFGEEIVQSGFQRPARFRFHSVNKEDSLKVVYLVLDRPGKKPAGGQGQFVSLQIQVVHLDPKTAPNGSRQSGKTEATLVGILFLPGEGEHGITDKERHEFFPVDRFSPDFHGGGPLFHFAEIHDGHLQGNSYLGSREPNALGLVHGGLQGGGQFVELWIRRADSGSRLA
jgi:hypothetical protein